MSTMILLLNFFFRKQTYDLALSCIILLYYANSEAIKIKQESVTLMNIKSASFSEVFGKFLNLQIYSVISSVSCWLCEDRCVATTWLTVLLSNYTLHRVAFNRCLF